MKMCLSLMCIHCHIRFRQGPQSGSLIWIVGCEATKSNTMRFYRHFLPHMYHIHRSHLNVSFLGSRDHPDGREQAPHSPRADLRVRVVACFKAIAVGLRGVRKLLGSAGFGFLREVTSVGNDAGNHYGYRSHKYRVSHLNSQVNG